MMRPAVLTLIAAVWVVRLACAQPAPGTVLWSFDTGFPISSSPALAADGTIYVSQGSGLCAVTNNGSVASNKWTLPIGIGGSPAVGRDGTVYVGGGDGSLYAVSPEGSQKWAYAAQGSQGSPAIGPDDTLYYEGYAFLHAITPAGTMRWKSRVGDANEFGSPVIGADGAVYIAGRDVPKFFAFGPDGAQRWVIDLPAGAGDSPAVSWDDYLYITVGNLYAFTSGGVNAWLTKTNVFFVGSSPVVTQDGTICVAEYYSRALYAVTGSGELVWGTLGFANPFHVPTTSPAVDAAGVLYYAVSNSVFALTAKGEVRWAVSIPPNPEFPLLDAAATSPIIGPDGTLYAALGSTLYAIATGTNGPANSPWPMYRGNAQHTGRIQKPSLQNPKKRADANFEFQIFSQVGKSVSIESSTNVSSWYEMTSIVPTVVPEPVVDLTASNSPVKFYRAKGGG